MRILQINIKQLEEWMAEERDFMLVDVREEEEHAAYNLGGELIPLSELSQYYHRFDIEKPIVIYCRKGIRSQIAIQRLLQKYPEGTFYNLTAGLQAQI